MFWEFWARSGAFLGNSQNRRERFWTAKRPAGWRAGRPPSNLLTPTRISIKIRWLGTARPVSYSSNNAVCEDCSQNLKSPAILASFPLLPFDLADNAADLIGQRSNQCGGHSVRKHVAAELTVRLRSRLPESHTYNPAYKNLEFAFQCIHMGGGGDPGSGGFDLRGWRGPLRHWRLRSIWHPKIQLANCVSLIGHARPTRNGA